MINEKEEELKYRIVHLKDQIDDAERVYDYLAREIIIIQKQQHDNKNLRATMISDLNEVLEDLTILFVENVHAADNQW